jgi:hypothetical protein
MNEYDRLTRTQILLCSLIALKCVKICRPTLFGYIETREELEEYIAKLFELLTTRKLKLFVHKVYPLSDVAQAHKVSSARRLRCVYPKLIPSTDHFDPRVDRTSWPGKQQGSYC